MAVDPSLDLGRSSASRARWAAMKPLAIASALLNLPVVLALFAMPHLHLFLQTLVVGLMVFVVPGFAWPNRAKGDAFVILFRIVVASLAGSLATWAIMLAWPGPTDRIAYILALAAIGNAGIWLGGWRRSLDARPFALPVVRVLFLVGALFYVQSYLGAAHFVPALEDQDMETQGTAYGLMHEGRPTMLTNRDMVYFFAHPLLLHFWIGESAILYNQLDRLRYHHDTAVALEHADRKEKLAQWKLNYEQFERDPVLMPTRAANLFLSLFTVLAMGMLIFRMTGSAWAAAGAGLIYMTMPEVYVRSSYGGYFAISNFLLASAAYFYFHAAGLFPDTDGRGLTAGASRRSGFVAAMLGGLSDQKAILVSFAAPAHAVLRILLDGALSLREGFGAMVRRVCARPDFIAAFLVGIGYVAGWMLFAIYGLSISADDFIGDHLKTHIVNRMKPGLAALAGGPPLPTVSGGLPRLTLVGLWMEFCSHAGWPLVVAFAASLALAVPKIRQAHGMFLLWIVIAGVGFSIVDWRQTKHLAHILPALVMLTAIVWASLAGRARMAASALIAVAFFWNVWRVFLQMQDFEYIVPKPIW